MPNQLQEIDMYRDRFESNWKQGGGKAKDHLGRFANDPLRAPAGIIQKRHRISNEEAARQLNDFLDHNRNWWDLANR